MAKFKPDLHNDLQKILEETISKGTPGVVAMVTDKEGNIFEAAEGKLNIEQQERIQTDSIFAALSTTKILTSVLLLQLVEEKLLKLSDPAKMYVPEIESIEVLSGFEGKVPITRKAKKDITLEHLMLHTAGFGYEFFHKEDVLFREYHAIPSVVSNTFDSIRTVLLHEPGEAWTYGVSTDWLGKVIEAVLHERLAQAMQRIFIPCNMRDSAFDMNASMQKRYVHLHNRTEQGVLPTKIALPNPTPMDMGGHGLHCSVKDYMRFIRMILNNGEGECGRVLQPSSVECMHTEAGVASKGWNNATPHFTNKGEFYPDIEKIWGYGFQRNQQTTNTKRPAQTLMWAGLANTYYFIDRQNGIGGYWASQILPFFDSAVYNGFLQFEAAIYKNLIQV